MVWVLQLSAFSKCFLAVIFPLPFCIHFRIILSISVKYLLAFGLRLHLICRSSWKYYHLDTVNLLIHEHGLPLRLLRFSLLYFKQSVVFLNSFKHIDPTYILCLYLFFVFCSYGIVLKFFIVNCSLPICRKIVGFHVFSLYSMILLNHLIVLYGCFVDSMGFPT